MKMFNELVCANGVDGSGHPSVSLTGDMKPNWNGMGLWKSSASTKIDLETGWIELRQHAVYILITIHTVLLLLLLWPLCRRMQTTLLMSVAMFPRSNKMTTAHWIVSLLRFQRFQTIICRFPVPGTRPSLWSELGNRLNGSFRSI